MTMYYTPSETKALEEDRAKDLVVAEKIGRLPESPQERDRLWRLLVLAANN
jgi:hypothetical protein